MKKLILFIVLFWSIGLLYAQKENEPLLNGNEHNLSPNGLFEKVFDHYGNSYNLSDILINKETRDNSNLRSTNPIPMNCGYYNLYFETGSGMEDISNPTHVERRNVLCRVITDLSNFINSPLTTNGLNNKVNIWVRNINNVITPPNSTNGVLGLASPFYTMPYNTTTGFGGIVDNEIWKTIHLGKDSYTNVISPLTSNAISAGQPGVFYHGMMAFNFDDSSINWNTNLTVTSFSNQYDLYSVILHEMTHALGFASLINSNGSSKFNSGYNYYSRYDTRLKNNANTQFLINKQTNACGSMYNYVFNTSLNTSVLQPASNACNNKIRYVGLSNVPVHTPTTFSPPSSLSHFEGVCVTPNPSFVMESSIGMNSIKRFLKPQERNVLGDLGYSVNTTFGVSSTYQGTATYTGTISGINVAGMNDGISSSGVFTYIGNASTNIQITNFLANDTNAIGFECLEDIYHASTLSTTSGNSSTIVTFNSSQTGLHLLRYVPTNGTQRGNITYIYVYIIGSNCIPTPCNIVNNGDFESSNLCGSFDETFPFPSPTIECWEKLSRSPDLFKRNCTNGAIPPLPNGIFNIGINTYQNNPAIDSHNGSSNDSFIGLYRRLGDSFIEGMQTSLGTPLIPGNQYQLRFWARVGNQSSNPNASIPVTFSSYQNIIAPINLLNDNFSNFVPNSFQLAPTTLVPNDNTWHLFSYNFTFDIAVNHQALAVYTGTSQSNTSYVYVDDISIIPISQIGSLLLTESICLNESINDLSSYLDNTPFNGTFSGNGVSGNTFNPTIAGVGVHTITYTYTNSTGCPISIYAQIEVLSSDNPDCINSCPDNIVFSNVENSTFITYNTSNFIEANTNYLVNSSSDVTLKAGNYIVIKPESQINSGSQFLGRIENCDGTQSAKTTNLITDIQKKSIRKNKNLSRTEENSKVEENFDISGLAIYPNPSQGLVNITTSLNAKLQINIFNLLGKEIVCSRISNNVLDVSNLTSGIYMVKITEEGKTATRKLVVK